MGSMHMFAINSHLLAIRTQIIVVAILLKVLFPTQGQLVKRHVILIAYVNGA